MARDAGEPAARYLRNADPQGVEPGRNARLGEWLSGIERLSGGICTIQQGSVYPALQRLLQHGWVVADWRATENHRRARYYRLTASGRRQLAAELEWWRRAIGGVDRVLRVAVQEEPECPGCTPGANALPTRFVGRHAIASYRKRSRTTSNSKRNASWPRAAMP